MPRPPYSIRQEHRHRKRGERLFLRNGADFLGTRRFSHARTKIPGNIPSASVFCIIIEEWVSFLKFPAEISGIRHILRYLCIFSKFLHIYTGTRLILEISAPFLKFPAHSRVFRPVPARYGSCADRDAGFLKKLSFLLYSPCHNLIPFFFVREFHRLVAFQ